jgi:HEPN domain-containing protein
MPPDASDPGSARRWVRYAEADLALAKVPLPPRGMHENLCFHAQQAVEKSLKAVLVLARIEVPNTHSIQRLVQLLPPDTPRHESLVPAVRLMAYAVSSRYPGENEPVLEDEYREAVEIAEQVVAWADELVRPENDD